MNFALSLLLAPLWAFAAWSWWAAVRNPRRRVWREDRAAMRRHDAMRRVFVEHES